MFAVMLLDGVEFSEEVPLVLQYGLRSSSQFGFKNRYLKNLPRRKEKRGQPRQIKEPSFQEDDDSS